MENQRVEGEKKSGVGVQRVLDHTEYKQMFQDLTASREEGIIKTYSFVEMMLKSMRRGSEKLEATMLSAMRDDLRIDDAPSYLMSLHPFKQELRCANGDLRKWYAEVTRGESRYIKTSK